MNEILSPTALSMGNAALRNKEYASAISYYKKALQERPELSKLISYNIDYAEKKYNQLQKNNTNSGAPYPKQKIVQSLEIHTNTPEDEITTLINSKLFDQDFYYEIYPDVKAAGLDAAEHFLKYGGFEGRRPCKYFDTEYYIAAHPETLERKINPLIHYITTGAATDKKPLKSFDPVYYREKYADTIKLFSTPLAHYIANRTAGNIYQNKNEELCANLEKLDDYSTWHHYNTLTDHTIRSLTKKLSSVRHLPKISVIMPVYRPPMEFLKKAIDSMKNQIYENWELCIADDCSKDPQLVEFLKQESESDPRIKFTLRETNGHISECTNSAANLASGEYLAFLDQDDELTQDALAEVVISINNHDNPDIIYSDDDKIDETGRVFDPQFKPAWSPELLLTYMYFSHLFVLRTEIFKKVGGLRKGLEGSQDYDLALRASELATNIVNIPKILYHWRVLPGSTAMSGKEKHYSFDAGIRATTEAMQRRGINAKSYRPDWAVQNGNGIFSYTFSDEGPSVALVIPTKDQGEILDRLLTTLARTTYKNYRVIVIDNDSEEPATHAVFKRHDCEVIRVSSPNGKFNYAYLNNKAVKSIQDDYVVFLNNDTEIIEEDWLSKMMGWAQTSGVGAVGVRLLYPDRTVQHGGILHNAHDGLPGHAFKHLPDYDGGYLAFAKVVRNCSAVTAACLLIKRDFFLSLGGFDETNFGVAYNDVDLCYRVIKADKRVVYAGDVTLIHHEGKSRGYNDNPREEIAFLDKYKDFDDIYMSRNLSSTEPGYTIKGKLILNEDIDLEGKRVLFYTHNLNYEGAPIQLVEIAEGMQSSFNIIPIFVSPATGPMMDRLTAKGIECHILPGVASKLKDDYESALCSLEEWFRELDFDCAFTNTALGFWVIDICNRLRTAGSWIIHESEPPFQHIEDWEIDAQIAARQALGWAYQVIFVAHSTKRLYESIALKGNLAVIHNGLDEVNLSSRFSSKRAEARATLGLNQNDVYIITVGTVCERKGQLDIVNCISNLSSQSIENTRFAIIGDRPSEYSSSIHNQINLLNKDQKARIEMIPETGNVGIHFRAADIFICSSRIESYPRVIQEAMFCGLAIITTPVFGIVEQVRNNISALFYTPGNYDELAQKASLLLENQDSRNRLGENAKTALGRLTSFNDMINSYSQIISEMLLYKSM